MIPASVVMASSTLCTAAKRKCSKLFHLLRSFAYVEKWKGAYEAQ